MIQSPKHHQKCKTGPATVVDNWDIICNSYSPNWSAKLRECQISTYQDIFKILFTQKTHKIILLTCQLRFWRQFHRLPKIFGAPSSRACLLHPFPSTRRSGKRQRAPQDVSVAPMPSGVCWTTPGNFRYCQMCIWPSKMHETKFRIRKLLQ